MRTITKSPVILALFSALNSFLFTVLFVLIPSACFKAIPAALGAIIEIIALLRYFSAEYFLSKEKITVKSGVFFKKTKEIPLENILMKSSCSIGRHVFLTALRTAGGVSFVLGKL